MIKIEIILLANNVVLPFQNLQKDFGLKFVELNKLFATNSLAEHGLGFLINIYDMDDLDDEWNPKLLKRIIFDTGSKNLTFLHNSDIRGYTLYDTDYIVLSHWHYDHTGALFQILERIEKNIPIICHADSKYERVFRRSDDVKNSDLEGKPKEEIMPLISSSMIVAQENANLNKIKELKGSMFYAKHSYELLNHEELKIVASGEIPRIHEEEDFNNFFSLQNGILKQDKILDDKCLILEFKDNVVVINGCCHAGLMNTIDYIKKMTDKEITHIIGGFHMQNASKLKLSSTINYLKTFQYSYKPLYLFPIHCSGHNFVQLVNSSRIMDTKAYDCSVGTVFTFKTNNF